MPDDSAFRKRNRDNGKAFVVRADEKLTAAVEFESVIRVYDKFCLPFLEAPSQHPPQHRIAERQPRFGLDVRESGNVGAQKNE